MKSNAETSGSNTADNLMEGRDILINYLRKELTGPADGSREELEGEPPYNRYTLGVLFAPSTEGKEMYEEEEEIKGDDGDESSTGDPVSLANQFLPSSMGLSFYFKGRPQLEVSVYGARYGRTKDGKSKWFRQPLANEESPEKIIIDKPAKEKKSRTSVLRDNAAISVHWRELGDGFLVTVTLVNSVVRNSDEIHGEDCICQAGFICKPVSGQIQEYPSVRTVTTDPEEQELQLLYRRNKIFAIGHGCSAEWNLSSGLPSCVKTEVLPVAYVRAVSHDMDGSSEILSVSKLADPNLKPEILTEELTGFTDLYENWITGLGQAHNDIPKRLSDAKERIYNRLLTALGRMRDGISLLKNDPDVLTSFRCANLAMLMQMRHGKDDLGGTRKERGSADTSEQVYNNLLYKWRPFQLAFQLLTLESVANDSSKFRETADLIWFPTGGGKTEAYLAVAAFEIFRRRLQYGDAGAGTAVITRYTLRLLTSQQFQRAARMISACEYIRRKNVSLFGEAVISIGFWAGGGTSPNKYSDAVSAFKIISDSPKPFAENKFQLDNCPWCGTGLLPKKQSGNPHDYGFVCNSSSFKVYCPTDSCVFHDRIPVSVIDEDLYLNPPSFLIGTVDKFARMAWIDGPGAFFGNNHHLPPSLIIQDELHLLSGPLGTTVGIYESAIEGLMAYYGSKPKIIASTATIRSAGNQVLGLFGRDTALFPSPGYSADDSFFARTDYSVPGRLYAGVMSSNHRSTTSAVRTASALLQAPNETDELGAEEKDAYWTLVIYHLSLRELGKTVSFARDDIPARIKIISSAAEKNRNIYDENIIELTSNLSAAEIPASLARMDIKYGNPECVSILACTNMLSVGVDIPRLGLMMMNGQPKTTSEYIQASSRVGRGKTPGIVVVNYAASKPRDRSHYESFQAYHSGIYRYVEPASVTPFSLPSRNRALHAALVILIRHGAGLSANDDAGRIDPKSSEVIRAVNILARQAAIKDPGEAAETRMHLDRLLEEWNNMAVRAAKSGYPFCYDGGGAKNIPSLLIQFGKAGDGWHTLNSMRNVDAQCEISLR
jgi:hypothetical protein